MINIKKHIITVSTMCLSEHISSVLMFILLHRQTRLLCFFQFLSKQMNLLEQS